MDYMKYNNKSVNELPDSKFKDILMSRPVSSNYRIRYNDKESVPLYVHIDQNAIVHFSEIDECEGWISINLYI